MKFSPNRNRIHAFEPMYRIQDEPRHFNRISIGPRHNARTRILDQLDINVVA